MAYLSCWSAVFAVCSQRMWVTCGAILILVGGMRILRGPCIQSAFEKRPAVFTARAAVSAQQVYFTMDVSCVYLCVGRVTESAVKSKLEQPLLIMHWLLYATTFLMLH